MDDENVYELLPVNCTTRHHLMAGAMGGLLEHSIMFPVDTVKTRLMCLHPDKKMPKYRGIFDGLIKITRQEGLRNNTKGIGAVFVGAGPAHALYFSSYEFVKRRLSSPDDSVFKKQFSYIVAGSVATICHDLVMTPVDAVKQRMQLFHSPYRNSGHCLCHVVRHDGVHVLYRAYVTQLLMNLPFQIIHFIAYEFGQNVLNSERRYSPLAHVLSGAFAGASAAIVTNPLDVCKTLLNTSDECARQLGVNKTCSSISSSSFQPNAMGSNAVQLQQRHHQKQHVRGLMHAGRLIWQQCGVQGFLRGMKARVVFQTPGTAISWSVYEYFKWQFLKLSGTTCSEIGVD